MDQKQISNLIAQFQDSRLAKLKMKMDGFEITLKSEAASQKLHVAPYHGMSIPVAPEAIAAPHPEGKTASADAEEAAPESEIISSPMVGTFCRSPAPDAPPYVDKGSMVNSGDAICIIEAMKIMNKLEADFSCEIVKIMAENGAMVEYGSPLFEVKRR